MEKKEALVDACFFTRFTDQGKCIEDFIIILDKLDYIPVIHPYIAMHELDMFSGFQQLVKDGYVKVASYSEFLIDEEDYRLYEKNFLDLHDRLRKRVNTNGKGKYLEEIKIPSGVSFFDYHKSGMSLGDVHLILMAVYMQIPIILTEDSDIAALKSLITSVINSDGYSLEILDLKELLMKFAVLKQEDISKKDLEKIVKRTGLRDSLSAIKQKWNENHSS